MVWDPQKPEISLLDPPMDPILAHFVCKKADFGVKNTFFSNFFCSKSFFIGFQMVWDPQKPKIGPLYPQWTPFGRAPALPVATQPAWSRT